MSNRTNTAASGVGGAPGKKAPTSNASRRGSTTAGKPAAGGPASSAASPRPHSPAVTAGAQANPTDLSKLLNLKLRLTVAATGSTPQRDVEGTLWTYDPATSFIVLTSPSASANPSVAASAAKRNYHMLRTSQIKSVTVLSSTPDTSVAAPSEPLRSISLGDVQSRVEKAVAEDKKMRARIGQGVSEEAQALFDALAKTLPVRWHESSIIVLEEVMISPPYTVDEVKGGKGAAQYVERVKKVLEGERQRRAARAIGFP